MKLYVVGAANDEIAEPAAVCEARSWEMRVLGRMGRPRSKDPVPKVLDAYEKEGSVRGAASVLSMPPGTVHRILRRTGVI